MMDVVCRVLVEIIGVCRDVVLDGVGGPIRPGTRFDAPADWRYP